MQTLAMAGSAAATPGTTDAVRREAGADTAEDAVMMMLLALGRHMRQRLPGEELDYSSMPLLSLLSRQGPMRLSGLAGAAGLDASTVSRHVRQLEDRGLLERTHDPDDRRASRVAVSEHGSACLTAGFAARRELITEMLRDWPAEDRETLRVLLQRLAADVTG